jgi:hypothetical protein
MLFAVSIFVNDQNPETGLEFKILFIYCKKCEFKNNNRRTSYGYPFALVDFKMSELKDFVVDADETDT